VAGGREARHLDADLRHHHLRGEITHSGQCRQEAGAVFDRRQGFSHARVHVREGLVQGLDEIEMDPQQFPVVRSDASAQGFHKLHAFFLGLTLSEGAGRNPRHRTLVIVLRSARARGNNSGCSQGSGSN
jgi:hypothetical protein